MGREGNSVFCFKLLIFLIKVLYNTTAMFGLQNAALLYSDPKEIVAKRINYYHFPRHICTFWVGILQYLRILCAF